VTWLLRLYPPRWRRRYGAEVAELVAAQPFSIGVAADLLAGAVDAWLHPQLAAPTPAAAKGETTMIAKILQFECAGYGREVTKRDKVANVAVSVGGTLALTLLWLWSQRQFGRHPYASALLPMAWFLPYLLSLRYTSLKGRSARTQTIFIAGLGGTLTVFLLLIGWIAARI
jgi:hypothetical protein